MTATVTASLPARLSGTGRLPLAADPTPGPTFATITDVDTEPRSLLPGACRAREYEPALFSKLLLSSFLLGRGPRGRSGFESAGRGPGDAQVVTGQARDSVTVVCHRDRDLGSSLACHSSNH